MIIVCTYVMIPLAVILLLTFQLRSVDLVEAAQTATAGLVTLIPEGLVLLMSVTFAVAAVRLAGRDTLVQQMSATESLAAVDTICVDKTGTLTDGNLKLLGVEIADSVEPEVAAEGPRPLRLQRRRAQPHPRGDRGQLPGPGRAGQRRGPVLLGLEVERAAVRGDQLRARRPRHPRAGRGAGADPGPEAQARPGNRSRPAGGRLRRIGRGAPRRPRRGRAAAAEAGGADRPRGDAAPRRRRDDRHDPRGRRRPEADLGRRAGDGDRGRLLGRGPARGRRRRRPRPPDRSRGAGRGRPAQHDLLPDRARAEARTGRGPARIGALHGDDRRRRQRRPGAEAGPARGRRWAPVPR